MDCVDQYGREASAAFHFLDTRQRARQATHPYFTTLIHCQMGQMGQMCLSIPPECQVARHKRQRSSKDSTFLTKGNEY
jgi:hypothetical protein